MMLTPKKVRTVARVSTKSLASSSVVYTWALARVELCAPKPAVKWLVAVVTHAHGDAGVVEHLAHVVGVDAVDDDGGEAKHVERVRVAHGAQQRTPGTIARRPRAGSARCARSCAATLSMPMCHQVLGGRAHAHRLRDRLRARLEARGRVQPRGLLERDDLDGASAKDRRRQGVEELRASPQGADAGRAEHLVSRERGEVHAERMRSPRGCAARTGMRRGMSARPPRGRAPRSRRDVRDEAGDVERVRERDDSWSSRRSTVASWSSTHAAQVVHLDPPERRRPCGHASCCHGMRLAWCSVSVTTIESPGPTRKRARLRAADSCRGVAMPFATRLTAAVAFPVHTISRSSRGADEASRPTARAVLERLGRLLGQQVSAALDRAVVVCARTPRRRRAPAEGAATSRPNRGTPGASRSAPCG